MDTDSKNYKVISVSSIMARDRLIKRMYTSLTSEPNSQFTVVQDQVNRIKIFHNVGEGVMVPIRTYLVICMPILVDLSPLYNLYGSIDFNLDNTIEDLTKLITKLKSLQGHKIIKGNSNNEQTSRQLANILS